MKWSDFETRITGAMLGNKSYTLTIAEVVIEEVHPRPGVTSKSPTLHFKETAKSLVLSPTNCRTLAHLFGDDVAGCKGKKIIIAAQSMRVAGRDTNPVRIIGEPKETDASLDAGETAEDDLLKDEPGGDE
jgi:hypothetical protein